VLSAHKLGQKGVEYYVSYAGRGTEGYWLGKAAASLGLVGAVDPAAFRALAKGEHPDGGRLLERVADRPHAGLGLHAVGAEVGIARLGAR
jgi:hypothetical protein